MSEHLARQRIIPADPNDPEIAKAREWSRSYHKVNEDEEREEKCEWLINEVFVEDVDGAPAWMVERRLPMISGAVRPKRKPTDPPTDQVR